LKAREEVKTILQAKDIELSFGGLHALIGVNVELKEGEILAVIGPNGAGKTCLLNCINGFYKPQKGEIFYDGTNITKWPAHKRAQHGIARLFQNIELYTGLSTMDNLMAGRHICMKQNALSSAFTFVFGPAHKEELEHRKVVEDIIDFLEIESIRKKTVGLLPYGQRKRIELGRALALDPKVLLLDEPMAGMNWEEKEDIARFIIDIYEQMRIPIMLVEHDMDVVMDISDRVVVFDFGRKIAEGTPQEIKVNPEVIRAYIGED